MSEKPTIVVTGADGQLGREIVLIEQTAFTVVGLSRNELDITDLAGCRLVMSEYKPFAVIHCAAYTAVDKAESEQDEAFRVNRDGTSNIALASHEIGAKLIYISTDYVFDGKGNTPYIESDDVSPTTVYGSSKLAGEESVQAIHPHSFIVRTSWVYGQYGNNFVKTMLSLAQQRKVLKVVADQIGSPTYTNDLARFLLQLVETDRYGIYHASNAGICSWYDFATVIFAESGADVKVEACTTAEFPRPAPRPAYSVMEHRNMALNGFEPMRHWQDALRDFLSNLNSNKSSKSGL
ncbi:MAG TPA: dTDP-4-dehydrorhamnose reductase [Candidatus Paenibacillus intestinavium]|nr:dTDP-4-dehydrorhamnose reductase [Candidatus Paenibacillus intestinavium]